MLSDKIGRKKTMSLTILFYSFFTFVSAFSGAWWHLVVFRFLVAMGVGGEWAVASALVAEVFPSRARAYVGGIFHASSVFGTYLAVIAGWVLIGNAQLVAIAEASNMPSLPWRIGFAIGVLPALLIIWIRSRLEEPESWTKARELSESGKAEAMGKIGDLFGSAHLRNTLVGVTLAAVGLATFWGAHIYGKNLLRLNIEGVYKAGVQEDLADRFVDAAVANFRELEDAKLDGLNLKQMEESIRAQLVSGAYWKVDSAKGNESDSESDPIAKAQTKFRDLVQVEITATIKRWELFGMFLVTTGGGIGLVCFGPISQSIGRKPAFLFYHIGGLIIALLAFQDGVLSLNLGWLMVLLPIFGFLTLGMHAGYAIYFPELYPTRLRGTGTGFCFNAGRIIAAPVLFITGWAQRPASDEAFSLSSFFISKNGLGLSLVDSCWYVSWLYLLGVVVVLLAKETRGEELPE